MWYYAEEGQQRGPVMDTDLEALRREGKINSETLVWREGMDAWQPLSQAMPGAASAAGAGVAVAAPAVAGASGATVACSECGNIFPVSGVMRYGNAAICPNCKPMFVQKLREGANISQGLQLAGFGTRFAAYFVDGIITGILGMIAGAVVGGVMGAAGATRNASGIIMIQLVAFVISMAIRAAYFIYFIGKDGQTPGKKMCKIKVVNPDGTQVSYGKATGRFFGYFLSMLILGIGFLMAAWDDEKRALHDRLCDTRVIKL